MLKVCESRCDECLFSKSRIVSKERMTEIIDQCIAEDRYFVCHKATAANEQVVCHGFYTAYGLYQNTIRVSMRQGWIEFVPPESLKEKQ
jgi:hypothetical protein